MRIKGVRVAASAAGLLLLTGCMMPAAASPTGGPASCIGGIAGELNAEQSGHARTIVQVALGLGLGRQGALVGVITANVETDLRNLPGGDRDSVGLFQQRAPWGSFEERHDPATAANMFYTGGRGGQAGLTDIVGWETMDPGVAMQAVQKSQFAGGTSPAYAAKAAKATAATDAIIVGCTAPGGSGANVANGVSVTVPNNQFVVESARGKTIQAPSEALARGIAAGFDQLGLPYVWGGSNANGGPADDGCMRGGGALNSCQGIIGFDCSGLTGFVLATAGFHPGTNSSAQRGGGQHVSFAEGRAGDIAGRPGHVALWLGTIDGQGYVLEASTVGQPVKVRTSTPGEWDSSLYRHWTVTGAQ